MKEWFKAKRYGWGWTPATWEGWLVLALAIGAIVLFSRNAEVYASKPVDLMVQVVLPSVLTIAALITVCWFTGEKPRWRWGK